MRQHIIREVNGREFAGESVTDEAIWQRDIVQGFHKQESDSIFPFFERLPWLARGTRTVGRPGLRQKGVSKLVQCGKLRWWPELGQQ